MFSFKINKKSGSTANAVQKPSAPVLKAKKAFNDDDDAEDDEPDFIDGLEGNQILSKKEKKVQKKAELVIPLITKNEWRIDKDAEEKKKRRKQIDDVENDKSKEGESEAASEARSETVKEATSGENNEDSLKQQAIKELLEGSSSKASDSGGAKSIPILFQNRVPDGYEEDDNMDVSLRPDQSTLDDYEKIPIEEFGLAMLRGMGWKETEGIGLKNKKVVDMAEPKLRPKGMGLGAEAAHSKNKDVAPKNAQDKDEKEELTFKIGGYAVITRGSKKGYYGQIESFDEDNNRVIMRLAISGKMEAVSKFYINLVTAKEYKKSSKVINSEKYEEYKSKQDQRKDEGPELSDRKDESYRSSRRDRDRSRSSDGSSDERDSRSRSKRGDRDRGESSHKSEHRKSGHRDQSRDEREDRHHRDKHSSSKRYDDRKYDHESSRSDDYHRSSSSKNGDRERRHDYRSSSKRDDGRDRRRDY